MTLPHVLLIWMLLSSSVSGSIWATYCWSIQYLKNIIKWPYVEIPCFPAFKILDFSKIVLKNWKAFVASGLFLQYLFSSAVFFLAADLLFDGVSTDMSTSMNVWLCLNVTIGTLVVGEDRSVQQWFYFKYKTKSIWHIIMKKKVYEEKWTKSIIWTKRSELTPVPLSGRRWSLGIRSLEISSQSSTSSLEGSTGCWSWWTCWNGMELEVRI